MGKRPIFADSTKSFHSFLLKLELEFFFPYTFPEERVCQRHGKGIKPFNLIFL